MIIKNYDELMALDDKDFWIVLVSTFTTDEMLTGEQMYAVYSRYRALAISGKMIADPMTSDEITEAMGEPNTKQMIDTLEKNCLATLKSEMEKNVGIVMCAKTLDEFSEELVDMDEMVKALQKQLGKFRWFFKGKKDD